MKKLLVAVVAMSFFVPVIARAATSTYTVPKDEPVSELAQQVGMYVPDLKAMNKWLGDGIVKKGKVVTFVRTKDKRKPKK